MNRMIGRAVFFALTMAVIELLPSTVLAGTKDTGVSVNGVKVKTNMNAADDGSWTYSSGVLHLVGGNGRSYVLSGTNTTGLVRFDVDGDCEVTLKNLWIETAKGKKHGAFVLADGITVNLTLEGGSYLQSGEEWAGVTVPGESTLNIDGTGSLGAVGGKYGAGIGGCNCYRILGLGQGYSGTECGTVNIAGGTVIAAGGEYGAGIGGGSAMMLYPNNDELLSTVNHGANGGKVNVSGGKVTAYGGGGRIYKYTKTLASLHLAVKEFPYAGGAGIGGGYLGNGTTMTFTGGEVKAYGGFGAAGIGGGSGIVKLTGSQMDHYGHCYGPILVSGGDIEAVGGDYAAGIGSGWLGDQVSDITVSGGVVSATGRHAIGAGVLGDGGAIYVTGGTVSTQHEYESPAMIGGLASNISGVYIIGGSVYATFANTPTGWDGKLARVCVSGLDPSGGAVKVVVPGLDPAYGTVDIYPDSKGCIYLMLPAGFNGTFTCNGCEYEASCPENVFGDTLVYAKISEGQQYIETVKKAGTSFDANMSTAEPAWQGTIYTGSTYGEFLANPTNGAWVFTGWYREKDCVRRVLESFPPTAGETLYARWQMNTIGSTTALDYTKSCYYDGEKWFGQTNVTYDCVSAMQSGVIGPNQSTTMYMRDFQGPGKISFCWMDSSGPNDSLTFLLDDSPVTSANYKNLWLKVTDITIPSGKHKLAWKYSKGASGAANDDSAYVDQFTFTPQRPENDDFTNAVELATSSGAVDGTSWYATPETDEPVEYSTRTKATNSVWYVWTAPEGANSATFKATGANYVDSNNGFRPVIGVHQGSALGSLTQKKYASNSNGTATAEFEVTGGEKYYIRIASMDGNGGVYQGDFTLEWTTSTDGVSWRPENDKRTNAIVLEGTSGATNKLSTTYATYEEGEPLAAFEATATNSVWFSWTAPYTGNATFTTLGSGFNTVLGVYTTNDIAIAENVNSTAVPGFTSRVYFSCTVGETYDICVAGYDGATGSLKLNWSSVRDDMIKVVFDGNLGTPAATTNKYDYGATAYNIATPMVSRTGYTFVGWYTDPVDGEEVTFDENYTFEVPVTFYAHWQPVSYEIEYDKNYDDASGDKTIIGASTTGTTGGQSMTYDEWASLETNEFTRTGYRFAEWNTASDGSGTAYADGEETFNLTTNDAELITLYAQWQKYAIGFDEYAGGDALGTIESSAPGVYTVTAADGVTLDESMFTYWIDVNGVEENARNGFNVEVLSAGSKIVITLATPQIATDDCDDDEIKDEDDPSGILVDPEKLDDEVSAPPTDDAGELGALPVNTAPGLKYQAAWGSDLNSMQKGEKVQATGSKLYMGVIKQTGDKGFYRIYVTE